MGRDPLRSLSPLFGTARSLGQKVAVMFFLGGGGKRGAILTFCSDRKLESESTVIQCLPRPGEVAALPLDFDLLGGTRSSVSLPVPKLAIHPVSSFISFSISLPQTPSPLYFPLNVQLPRGWWLLHA